MSLFEVFIIGSLATYRLTAMIHNEAGPADMFGKFRSMIGVKFDQYSNPYGTNWVAEGVLCFYCLSVWIGFVVMVWLMIAALLDFILLGVILLFPLAFSGVAVYLKKAVG